MGMGCMPTTACTLHAGALRILMCDGLRIDEFLPAAMALSQSLQLGSTAGQGICQRSTSYASTQHHLTSKSVKVHIMHSC